MLAELLEAFEPVVSAMLVAVANKKEVEKLMDLRERLLLREAGVEECGGCYDGVSGGHGGMNGTSANGHGTLWVEDCRHIVFFFLYIFLGKSRCFMLTLEVGLLSQLGRVSL